MIYKKKLLIFSIFIVVLTSCSKEPEIDNEEMLDGNILVDSSLLNPSKFLLSSAIPNPSDSDLTKPVLIAVHGFSASTFEWDEFKSWSDSVDQYYLSRVLLGGHGRDYESFKKSTWQDWQRPIIEEYNRLDSMGYKNISLIGASTGCPLILEMLYDKKLKYDHYPSHVIFIDPIVIPSAKALSLVDFVGPLISYVKTDLDSGEQGYYYQFRPQEALNQLLKCISKVRKDLEDGVILPAPTFLKVYKSMKDPSADPISALLLYKGITLNNGNRIDVEMVNSDLHVFTRLKGRNSFTASDKATQLKTFKEIEVIISQ